MFKKLKKIFRKITSSTIGKVIFGALALGAVVFTGGAALGLGGIMAGGWGGAMTSLAGTLGLSGSLGSAFAGALTMAGYGGVLGGAMAAIGGGDIMEGVASGGLLGGITGGAMGGMGFATDPLAGAFGEGGASATAATTNQVQNLVAPTGQNSMPMSTTGFAPAAPQVQGGPLTTPLSSSPAFTTAAGTAPAAAPSGGLFGAGGWVERNGALVGSTVAGLGQGLVSGMASQDASKSEAELRDRVAGSFNIDYTDPKYTGMPNPTPEQKFGTRATGKRYAYNPETRRVELVDG